MTTGVLIVDRAAPSSGVGSWTQRDPLLGVVAPSELAAAVAWTGAGGITDLILLTRRRDASGARRLGTVVAGALPRVGTAVIVTDHGTLAMACIAALSLEGQPPANEVHHRLISSLAASQSGVVLSRVTGLQQPAPSMWQHLSSLFGRHHLVRLSPQPKVLGVAEHLKLPSGGLLIVGAPPESADLHRVVRRMEGAGSAQAVVPAISVRDAFGSAGVEFVVLMSGHPVATLPCPACAHEVSGAVCPMCHVRVRQEQFA